MSYLFGINPGTAFTYYIPLIVLSGLLILGGIVFSIYYKKRKNFDIPFKRLFKKLSSTSIIFGGIFLIFVAVRYETIPYFSMRIWLYLSFVLFLYFIYKYARISLQKYPKEKLNAQLKKKSSKKEGENKYLPNKNKK